MITNSGTILECRSPPLSILHISYIGTSSNRLNAEIATSVPARQSGPEMFICFFFLLL